MTADTTVVIEAALNGGRDRREHPGIPYLSNEIAAEGRRCADEGATVLHVHGRDANGGWSADPSIYAGIILALRQAAPAALISITSIRPSHVRVDRIIEMLTTLASHPDTAPDLVSINLGHIVHWQPTPGGPSSRRTVHVPNSYQDIVRLLQVCRDCGIGPELGLMDLGFVSNAVTLVEDGVLPTSSWCLLELDSPRFGAGDQVAPGTVANYQALVRALHDHLPDATWAAHGQGTTGFSVVRQALIDGAHARVGFEDSLQLENGELAPTNAALVAWAVAEARKVGRMPASPRETRQIVGLPV